MGGELILLMLLHRTSLPSQLSQLPGATHTSPGRDIPANRPQTMAVCRAPVSAVSPWLAPAGSPAVPSPASPSVTAGQGSPGQRGEALFALSPCPSQLALHTASALLWELMKDAGNYRGRLIKS